MEQKQERVQHLSTQLQNLCCNLFVVNAQKSQRACGCRKAGLKCSIICTNCSGTWDNSQDPLHDSDKEEEMKIVFEQKYDGIEEDRD